MSADFGKTAVVALGGKGLKLLSLSEFFSHTLGDLPNVVCCASSSINMYDHYTCIEF